MAKSQRYLYGHAQNDPWDPQIHQFGFTYVYLF